MAFCGSTSVRVGLPTAAVPSVTAATYRRIRAFAHTTTGMSEQDVRITDALKGATMEKPDLHALVRRIDAVREVLAELDATLRAGYEASLGTYIEATDEWADDATGDPSETFDAMLKEAAKARAALYEVEQLAATVEGRRAFAEAEIGAARDTGGRSG